MPGNLDLSVPATTRGLSQALNALDTVCGPGHALLGRARIVLEELFTNTIKYGYGGECERPVRLAFRLEAALTFVIEDEAPPFDPTQWVRPAGSLERVGQAGIAMVMGLSSQVSYQALANGNRITVVIR
jgi:anti-sigma regulatory factor (Ser/Thr protein kinase)